MTTSAPPRRARSAAASLVLMPPVPSPLRLPPARARRSSSMCSTSGMSWRVGVAARVGGEQAGLVGEHQQQVGLHQVGHQRRQVVVVAQLDLVGGDGVVLVDDRHDALGQQRLQGVARVEVAAAVVQIGRGSAAPGRRRCRRCRRTARSGAISRLWPTAASICLAGMAWGSGRKPSRSRPARDGAGADHHHLDAGRVQARALAHDVQHARPVELRRAGGQDAGAQLEDEATTGEGD